MKRKPFFFLVIVIISLELFLSNKVCAIESDFRLWTPIYLQYTIKDKYIGYFEVSPRLGDNVTDLTQLVLRPAVGYKLKDNLTVWQGYTWSPNFLPRFRNENRIWQQLQHVKSFGKLELLNQFRLEERFIENIDSAVLRTRYLLQLGYPLDKRNLWTFLVSNKLYLNYFSVANGPEGGIEQNRIYAGIRRKITKNINLETGYQFQHIFRNGRPNTSLIHSIISSIYINN